MLRARHIALLLFVLLGGEAAAQGVTDSTGFLRASHREEGLRPEDVSAGEGLSRREKRKMRWASMPKHWASFTYGPPLAAYVAYGGLAKNYSDNYGTISSCLAQERGPVSIAGAFCFQYGWNCNRTFNPFVELDLSPSWTYSVDPLSKVRTSSFAMPFAVAAGTRIMYINQPKVRFYATLGVSFALCPKLDSFSPSCGILPQLSLLGLEIGRKWFFNCDLGFNAGYFSARIGAGCKF